MISLQKFLVDLFSKLSVSLLGFLICPNFSIAQDITLADGQTVNVTNGQIIQIIDGETNAVSGANITIEAGGIVTGRDAFELSDTTNVTLEIYGTIDSADGGVVGAIYSVPPGNIANGDDAIVAKDTIDLTVNVRNGALVLADDEFINGSGSTEMTVLIEKGTQIYAQDQGVDDINNSTITVNGFVKVGDINSATADGIDAKGNNTVVIGETGVIIATDDGIQFYDSTGSTAEVAGSITADDNGIEADSKTSIVISATGRVTASDAGVAVHNNNVIDIYGTVNGGIAAIRNQGNDNVTTIRAGAKIIGDIENSGANNTIRFDIGSAQSYVFSTTGNWTLQDLDGRAVVEGSAMAAGIGNAETADELMFDRSISLNNSLNRLERQNADDEQWTLLDIYRSSQSRDENGTLSAYEMDSRSTTIGIPVKMLGSEAIAFANYHDSELDIASGTHDISVQSLRFGVAIPEKWSGKDYRIGAYAIAGRNFYDGIREVLVNENTTTGLNTIGASWDSVEIETSLDFSSSVPVTNKLTLESSLGLAAQIERVGSYFEDNYFAWDSRTLVQAHAKAEAILSYQATDATRIYGTVGAWHRDVRGGETARYKINNTAVSYKGGVYDDMIPSLRVRLVHQLRNNDVFKAEAFATDSISTGRSYGVSLGVVARF